MHKILNFLNKNKLFLAMSLFAFCLSFDPDWSSKGLLIMLILSTPLSKTKPPASVLKYIYVLFFIVIWGLINMLLLSESISFTSITTPLLSFLFLVLIKVYKKIMLKPITIFFTTGVFISGVINLITVFLKNENIDIFDSWAQYFIVDIHKTYYGAFLNISLLLLFYLRSTGQISYQIIRYIFPFYIIFLISSGSIINLLILILITAISVLYKFKSPYYKPLYVSFLCFPFLFFSYILISDDLTIISSLENDSSRERNFHTSKQIIKKAPFYGHGIGEELNLLQKYRNKKSWEFNNNYNTHNQYFHFLIGGGVIYLIISFLPLLMINFKDNKIFENLFINGFTLILIYIYLTETFQERHHGQMFYAFFLYLAILEKHHKEVINESI